MNSIFINFGTFFDINKNATDKYISYWISEKDSGMYEAIQKGFNKKS